MMNIRCVSRATPLLKFLYSNTCAVSSISSVRRVDVSWCLVQSRLINSSFTCCTREENAKSTKKKTKRIPEITLLQPDNSMVVTTLAVAEKLAKRRNLSLVKVEDINAKTKRETYSLTDAGRIILNEERQQMSGSNDPRKTEKLITIHSKIQKSDLLVKCKQISRLLSKKHVVRIGIFSDAGQNEEVIKNINDTIVEYIKDKAQCTCCGKKTQQIIIAHPLDTDNE